MKNILNHRIVFLFVCLTVFSVLIFGCTRNPGTVAQNTSSIPASTSAVSSPSLTSSALSSSVPSFSSSEIVSRASQGVSNIQDYQLHRYTTNTESTKSDNSDRTTLDIVSQMVLDSANGKLQMDNSFSVRNSGAPLTESSLYIVDGVLYLRGIFPNQPELWTKTPAPPGYLDNLDQARQLVDLLKSSSVTVLSPQTLQSSSSNITCDVLQVNPDMKKLWALVVDQPGVQLPSGEPPVAFDHFIKQTQMKIWLSQTSGAPVSSEVAISLLFDPAEWPNLTDRVSIDLVIQMSFSAYNQRPSIVLPDEAKTANDLNLQRVTPTP